MSATRKEDDVSCEPVLGSALYGRCPMRLLDDLETNLRLRLITIIEEQFCYGPRDIINDRLEYLLETRLFDSLGSHTVAATRKAL